MRIGCARSQDGKVLVLKRECTKHMYDVKSGACRSRKYEGTCRHSTSPSCACPSYFSAPCRPPPWCCITACRGFALLKRLPPLHLLLNGNSMSGSTLHRTALLFLIVPQMLCTPQVLHSHTQALLMRARAAGVQQRACDGMSWPLYTMVCEDSDAM